MNRLNKSVQINPTFSWVDWELYDMPGSSVAAVMLNDQLADLVNAGLGRAHVERSMSATMAEREFSEYGASDTEPRVFLEEVLNEIYGERE